MRGFFIAADFIRSSHARPWSRSVRNRVLFAKKIPIEEKINR